MNLRVISGGQEGVDASALRVAKRLGLETGGTMPLGWLTEAGPRPEYADLYGMVECQEPGYPARTKANAKSGHVTLWLGPTGSTGYRCTRDACKRLGKPFIEITDLSPESAFAAATIVAGRLLFQHDPVIVNAAGSRASKAPGISEQAEAFLIKFLPALASSRLLG
ncbi:YpsA SLOG family protein [Paludisphaera borealis]|uniref:Molybdenum carrier n=1 Tax=Paludisphaera borealis TaxID=1387353 RepID=A0A1U7CNG8_9BACT|nr:putative molybdenum carrier protein [Paludisphaera borealis]APW60458.1 hypothetical protein BSF38_01928 [Paludisphaera borealis]